MASRRSISGSGLEHDHGFPGCTGFRAVATHEALRRREGGAGTQRTRLRNSARVAGFSRKAPIIIELTMTEFCFSTPRIIMHMC